MSPVQTIKKWSKESERDLRKMGAGSDTAAMILGSISKNSNPEARAKEIVKFAKELPELPGSASYWYFKAIAETKAVEELTSKSVMEFAKELPALPGSASYWYFRAIAETKAVEELTGEKVIQNKEVMEFVKGLPRDAVSSYFHAIGNTKAVEELTSKSVMEFAKGLPRDAVDLYFKAITVTKAVEELTSKSVMEFAKGLPEDAAYYYFKAIGNIKAVEELTSKSVMEFVKGLPRDAVDLYFKAITVTKAVEELTSKSVMEFAKGLPGSASYWYFRAIAETKAVEELTGEKVIQNKEVMEFVKGLPRDAVSSYFHAIGNTKAVEELTSEKVIQNKGLLEFAKGLPEGVVSSYFHAIGNTKAVEEFTSNESINEMRKAPQEMLSKLFASALEHKEFIAEAFRYYPILFRNVDASGDGLEAGIIYDRKFCDAALHSIKKGSAEPDTYYMAEGLYRLKDRMKDFDLDTFFSLGKERREYYAADKCKAALAQDGLKNLDALAVDDLLVLVRNTEYAKDNARGISVFARRKRDNVTQRNPLTSADIRKHIISEHPLGDFENIEADQKSVLESLVYAINGSREKENERKANEFLSRFVDRVNINRAHEAWNRIRTVDDITKLSAAYRAFTEENSTDNAMKVVSCIREAVKNKRLEQKEPVSDLLDTFEDIIEGKQKTVTKGEKLIAFYNKDNILRINANNTGCCAFMGGVNSHAALNYANDDGIALINFGIGKGVVSTANLDRTRVYGVAICAFAKVNGKRALFVDSVESGLTLWNAVKGDTGMLLNPIMEFAKESGCKVVAFFASPSNSNPHRFLESLEVSTQNAKIELMIEPMLSHRQYLEGLHAFGLQKAEVKIIEA